MFFLIFSIKKKIFWEGENFSFDLSDSYVPSVGKYLMKTAFTQIERIIYHEDMNYFTLFGDTGSLDLNSSTPNQLIDYR